MRKRILISLIFIPVLGIVIYAPFLHGLLFFLFVLLVSALASLEVYTLSKPLGIVQPGKTGRTGIRAWFVVPPLLLLFTAYTIRFVNSSHSAMLVYTGLAIPPTMWILSCISWKPAPGTRAASLLAASYVYCGVCPLLLFLLQVEERGFLYVYFLLIAAWVNDAAAFFVGTFFGRTRGIVKYSPNKSLEGYLGAFFATMIAVNGFKLLIGDGFPPDLLLTNALGLCVAITAPLGDLGESIFKRRAGVKDSSGIIPGMGGVLDVFDSVLVSVPIFFVLVKILV
jgi:phosphatidate cytidylyltransferase